MISTVGDLIFEVPQNVLEFQAVFNHCCVSLLSLFQKSLRLINRALKTNVWRALVATHQKSSKHISKPEASYFLTSPYARLGWLVIFSSTFLLTSGNFEYYQNIIVDPLDTL